MNTKFGQLLSTLLIIGLALFWSASILAAETEASEQTVGAAESSRIIAADATEAAANEAAASIAQETKVELEKLQVEILIVDQNSLRAAAD